MQRLLKNLWQYIGNRIPGLNWYSILNRTQAKLTIFTRDKDHNFRFCRVQLEINQVKVNKVITHGPIRAGDTFINIYIYKSSRLCSNYGLEPLSGRAYLAQPRTIPGQAECRCHTCDHKDRSDDNENFFVD